MLEHGGNLREAALRFKRPLADWLDLSAGLNPVWYPAPELAGNAWHRVVDLALASSEAFSKAFQAVICSGFSSSRALM